MSRRFLALLSVLLGMLLLIPTTAVGDTERPSDTKSASPSDSPSPSEGEGSGGQADPPSTGTQVAQAGKAVPRVMLTAFSTEPAIIKAGESFDVRFTLENKSKSEAVSNIKVTLSSSSEGIIPSGGSASTYIERIKARGSVGRSMTFSTLPTLEGRPHTMTLSLEYQDAEHSMLTTEESVSVVVTQTSRASTSPPQLSPAQLAPGMEGSLSFSVNNLGKGQLYNTRVAISPGQVVTAPEVFIGNIEAGASKTVEMVVSLDSAALDDSQPIEPSMQVSTKPIATESSSPVPDETGDEPPGTSSDPASTEGPSPIEVTVTFEDANGVADAIAVSFQVDIQRDDPQQFLPGEVDDAENSEEQGTVPWWMIVLPIAVVLALIVVIALVAKSRKRADDLREDIDFLGEEPLVPADPQ